jgi:membrane-bound lytic murein transglycosylase B
MVCQNKMNKCLALILVLMSNIVLAEDDPTFKAWLAALKEEARAKSISEQTIFNTFKEIDFLPNVIVLDRSQPEFISTFFTYIRKRVTRDRVEEGRLKLQKHQLLLNKIEQQYGVNKNILVAFWGLETNFGANKGSINLASALMTLSYEGRRATFFRQQLFDLMRIVDAGHNEISAMKGSWAGASGHMQFMPSTFLDYSVDANEDGVNDIWNTLPDAFASAANYLSSIGWRKSEPVAIEVTLPKGFEYYQAQLGIRQSSKDWAILGVTQVDGTSLPKKLENAAIILPQGWQGPAFLVASNFDVIMKWNRSINYALSVSHLADQLTEDRPIVNGWNVDNVAITFNQAWAMQAKLNQLGYDSGKPDGYPGTKTQAAIRNYQLKQALPADGFPSYELFNRLMRE